MTLRQKTALEKPFGSIFDFAPSNFDHIYLRHLNLQPLHLESWSVLPSLVCISSQNALLTQPVFDHIGP